ncbi:histidine kinase dimerization/phospho-acceptor domain-containing protein [Caballeronia terrestris]|nr:histidine kinase dimerization/phospho-acceptor domain-containing protein [Caballeronia terrestris]
MRLARTLTAARAERRRTVSEPLSASAQADWVRAEAHRVALTRFAPAFVICDDDFNIVEFRGDTAPYLVNPNGPPSVNLQKLARPDVFLQVSQAPSKARQTGQPCVRALVQPNETTTSGAGSVEVHPLQSPGLDGRWYVVFFEDAARRLPRLQSVIGKQIRAVASGSSQRMLGHFVTGRRKARDEETAWLKSELEATRDQYRATLEQHESAQEELRSSEAELLSSNEEFQSTNEELETAKEELQSVNEELSTTNDELQFRNRELLALHTLVTQERDYANAVIETMSQPMLVLESDLRVVRANSAFYQKFRVSPEATIDARLYALGNGQWAIEPLRKLLDDVVQSQSIVRDFTMTHAFPEIGVRTMRLNASRVAWEQRALILLAFDDITEQTAAIEQLQTADAHKNEFLAMLAHELRNPLAAIRNGLQIWKRKDVTPEIEERARLCPTSARTRNRSGGRPARRLAHHARHHSAENGAGGYRGRRAARA